MHDLRYVILYASLCIGRLGPSSMPQQPGMLSTMDLGLSTGSFLWLGIIEALEITRPSVDQTFHFKTSEGVYQGWTLHQNTGPDGQVSERRGCFAGKKEMKKKSMFSA